MKRQTALGVIRDTILMCALLGAAVGAFFYFGHGYRLNVVQGASMDPTLPSGALVITKPVESIDVGKILKFRYNGFPVMHRVVDIDLDGRLITKGDNADQEPELHPISTDDVIAEYAFSVPPLGGLWHHMYNNRALVVGATAAMLFLLAVPDMSRQTKATSANAVDGQRASGRHGRGRHRGDRSSGVGVGHLVQRPMSTEALARARHHRPGQSRRRHLIPLGRKGRHSSH